MSVEVTKPARRGRPRKYPLKADTTSAVVVQEKPREERSFEEFFPDLNIKEPLNLINYKAPLLILTTELSLMNAPKEYGRALPLPTFEKLVQRNNTNIVGSFQRPENHYIHYQEPSDSELFEMVEYDMDEQDQTWLKILNKERKKENLGQVSNVLFEAIIDNLEKEWFDLVKYLPKRTEHEASLPEDSTCAVCDDGECENSNAIVFCDGCNLAVHQDCYGVPYIPEGQWLCRKCARSPDKPVSCIFCPFEGGAFKQTTTGQWGHLLCAIWIPEVNLKDSTYMEPIENVDKIPKSRWKLNCYICRRRHGACIQCDNKQCFTAFHVTCARWARLCMRMNLQGAFHDGVALKAYCERHTPEDYEKQINVGNMVKMAQQWFAHKRDMPRKRYVDEEEQNVQQAAIELLPTTDIERTNQHQYTSGAPIAPDYIMEKLETLPCVQQATDLKKKSSLITSICRYWSLKRGARRGAPLLKRLHLESWTTPVTQLKQTEVEKANKKSSMFSLRTDLEKVRILSGEVKKRERQKLERIKKQKAYLEMILYPIDSIITPIIKQLITLDKKEIFRNPVTKELAPDYFEFIKQPMSFSDILSKIDSHQYLSLDEFGSDLSLIWSNCMSYNKPETTYHKQAMSLKAAADKLMKEARNELTSWKIKKNSSFLDVEIDPDIFEYKKQVPVAVKSPVPPVKQSNKKVPGDEGRSIGKKRRRSPSQETVAVKKKKLTRTTRSATEKIKRASITTNHISAEQSSIEDVIPRSNEQSSMEDVIPSSIEQSSIEDVTPSSNEQSSMKDVTPSSNEQSSMEDVIRSSIEQSSIEDVTPSSNEQSSMENVIPIPVEQSSMKDAIRSSNEQSRMEDVIQDVIEPTSKVTKKKKHSQPIIRRITRSAAEQNKSTPNVIPSISNKKKLHSDGIKKAPEQNEPTSSIITSITSSSTITQVTPVVTKQKKHVSTVTRRVTRSTAGKSNSAEDITRGTAKETSNLNTNNTEQHKSNDTMISSSAEQSLLVSNTREPPNATQSAIKQNKRASNATPHIAEQTKHAAKTKTTPTTRVLRTRSTSSVIKEPAKMPAAKPQALEKSPEPAKMPAAKPQALENSPEPDPKQTPSSTATVNKHSKQPTKKTAAAKTQDPESSLPPPTLTFVPGEIVWARVPRFPSHPAQIYDPVAAKNEIPDPILMSKPKESKNVVLVKFFLVGKSHTWSWVQKPDVNPFGHPTIDSEMMYQAKGKGAARVSEVKRAYRHVCSSRKIDPELVIAKVFPKKRK